MILFLISPIGKVW